jgi:RNA polymerase sigma-70 factor (ECF subfamily)
MEPRRPLESTMVLLDRIRVGDPVAREQLLSRYLPILRAWAHGRLPASARGLADTDDVVQVTLLRALRRLGEFEYRHEGAFLSYLRQGALNTVRQEIRRARRRPTGEFLDDEIADDSVSVVEQAIGREALERYEAELMRLEPDQREAVILRFEFGLAWAEVAEAMGRPSPNAARMLVVRALTQLAQGLGDD